jgi:hypothetical protein
VKSHEMNAAVIRGKTVASVMLVSVLPLTLLLTLLVSSDCSKQSHWKFASFGPAVAFVFVYSFYDALRRRFKEKFMSGGSSRSKRTL